ncbi:EamA/RhaT family transporter, partial [Acinetobacter seifertii]|nr:EamA/RhaT family transporter [Acinetobacter seifertii]
LILDEKLEIKFGAGSILGLSEIIIMSLKQGQPNKG